MIEKQKLQPVAVLAALTIGSWVIFGGSAAAGQSADFPAGDSTAVPASQPSTTDVVATPTADAIGDLNTQISEKKKRLEELKRQSAEYEKNAQAAASRVRDITSQISAIDEQIAQTNFDIQLKQEQIDELELEVAALQHTIDDKTTAINQQKEQLAEAVRQVDENSRTPLLNILLTHRSLAEFFSQAAAMTDISQSLDRSLTTLRQLKAELEKKQQSLKQTQDSVEQSKAELELKRQSTEEQKSFKATLLSDATSSVDQYDELIQAAAREEQQANATISALERQVQEQLAQGETPTPTFSSTGFIWPLQGTITARFHDPDYPFSCRQWKSPYCLEHSGLDIGTSQGTPVRAAADGIVSVVNAPGFYVDGGRKRSALNFVGLVHENGLSTRYLHLSAVYVSADQFIKQGEIIGLSGGLPGTAGAGSITTGPHLHFEVRSNGIPDDPLRYLP